MRNLSCVQKFSEVVQTLPRLDVPDSLPLFKEQIETELVEDFEELSSKLEQLNSDNTAYVLAQIIDEDQTKAQDLDDNALPKKLLTHPGDTVPRNKVKDIGEFLEYFNELIEFGFENQANTKIQAALNKLVEVSYQFIKDFYDEARSLASMLSVRASLIDIQDKYVNKGNSGKDRQFQEYLAKQNINYQDLTNNQEQKQLLKYSESILSMSNEELLGALTGPVKYSHLGDLADAHTGGAQLIEPYFEGKISKEQFNQKYLDFVRTLDEKIKVAESTFDMNESQRLMITLISMRELIALDYDEGAWRERVSELQGLIPENPEDDY